MNSFDFWKNFRLGEEVHTAGSFIYNAQRQFHELKHFDNGDELFEFLYNLSVGIERLLKIVIVLHEHTNTMDQELLEQSLMTHNHLELALRVRKHVDIKFADPQNDLLQLLGTFYKTLRYDRFSLDSIYKGDKEASAVLCLLRKYLNIELIKADFPFVTQNEDRYRAFIRRTVLKISQTLYKTIVDRAHELGLYTYELRSGSKAERVFLREVDIGDEDILWKELLIFFMNSEFKNGYGKFLQEIKPLEFDPASIGDFLDCFQSDSSKAEVMDELEHQYFEMDSEERKQRIESIKIIGAQGVYFNDGDPSDSEE